MSKTSEPQDLRLEKTWLSSLFFALGTLLMIASVGAALTGSKGFVVGAGGFVAAAIFFALGRMLDYLHEIRERLVRLKNRLGENREQM